MPRIEKSSETPPLVSELMTPGTFLRASNEVCGLSLSIASRDTTLLLAEAAWSPVFSGGCSRSAPRSGGVGAAGGVVELSCAWANEKGNDAQAAPISKRQAVTLRHPNPLTRFNPVS